MVLQLVNAIVQQFLKGSGGNDRLNRAAGDQQQRNDGPGVLDAGLDHQQSLPGIDGRIFHILERAGDCPLAFVQIIETRRSDVRQQASHQNQTGDNQQYVRHFAP